MVDPQYLHLCGIQRRLLSYKKHQHECRHMDGWRSLPFTSARGLMQCMTCGLVAPEKDLRRFERWVEEDDFMDKPTALEYEVSKWEGGMRL